MDGSHVTINCRSISSGNRSWIQHIHLQPWTQVWFPYLSNKWSPNGNNIGGIFLKFIPRIWGIPNCINHNYCGWFVALWALDGPWSSHCIPIKHTHTYIYKYTHIYAPILSPSCPHHAHIISPLQTHHLPHGLSQSYPPCIPFVPLFYRIVSSRKLT